MRGIETAGERTAGQDAGRCGRGHHERRAPGHRHGPVANGGGGRAEGDGDKRDGHRIEGRVAPEDDQCRDDQKAAADSDDAGEHADADAGGERPSQARRETSRARSGAPRRRTQRSADATTQRRAEQERLRRRGQVLGDRRANPGAGAGGGGELGGRTERQPAAAPGHEHCRWPRPPPRPAGSGRSRAACRGQASTWTSGTVSTVPPPPSKPECRADDERPDQHHDVRHRSRSASRR